MEEERVKQVGAALLSLNYGLPQAPGLAKPNIQVYANILQPFSVAIIVEAITRLLEEWDRPRDMPTPGQIRRYCIEILSAKAGLPTADAAWSEVVSMLRRYGASAKIEWSHPAIGQAVEFMGGQGVLATSDNLVADRSHWMRYAWPSIMNRLHVEFSQVHQQIEAARMPELEAGNGQ